MKLRKIVSFLMLFIMLVTAFGCDMGGSTSKLPTLTPDEENFASEVILNDFDIRDWYFNVQYPGEEDPRSIQVTYNMLSTADIKKLTEVGDHTLTFNYEGATYVHNLKITFPSEEELLKLIDDAKSSDLVPATTKESFTLPSTFGSVNIEWSTESAYVNILGTKAVVTRPSISSGDATAKLTATFSIYNVTKSYDYNVVIEAMGQDEVDEYLDEIREYINVPSSIVNALDLLFVQDDVQITWASSNTTAILINNDREEVIVNPVLSETTVILSYTLTYMGDVYEDNHPFTVKVIPQTIVTKAPKVTNLEVNDKVATWTKAAGVTNYAVYVGSKLVSTTTANTCDLSKYLVNNGTYIIGVISLAGGAYNTDSEKATTNTTVNDGISYNGTYYQSANLNLTGAQLKASLRTLVQSTHKSIRTYEDLKTDLAKSDVLLDDSSKVLLIYSRKAVKAKWSSGGSIWNREHVWAQSLGWFTTSGAGADAHHLRPEDPTVNSTRGNHPFGEFTGGSDVKFSTANGGGASGCYLKNGYFMPREEAKGDVARILFYLLVRYNESDSYKITVIAQSMDMLLRWNEQDPVDEWEVNRNDVVQSIQGNRNPFIDYPNLANEIWG